MLHANHKLAFTAKTLSLVVAFMFFLASCNSDKKKTPEANMVAAPAFKLNCVIIEKTQLQPWVDRGWTDPSKPDSLIKKILLQFYSADATNANTNMQLATFPGKSFMTVYAAGRVEGAIDPSCTALTPTGKAILGNSYLSIPTLEILDPSGKLTDFSFIRLRPIQNRARYGDYITYKWEVVKVGPDNVSQILKEGQTSDPCPTFCEQEEGQ